MPIARPLRFGEPVDLEAHLALLPSKATCKGLFINGVIEQVRKGAPGANLFELAGLPRRRYVAFLDYPYGEFLRLVHAAGGALHPHVARGEGIRRIGQGAFELLFDVPFGKTVFGALGLRIEQILQAGPKAYGFAINFGSVRAQLMSELHVRYEFRDLPGFLETYQAGVIEGAMFYCGLSPMLTIELRDLANATLDVRWTYLMGR